MRASLTAIAVSLLLAAALVRFESTRAEPPSTAPAPAPASAAGTTSTAAPAAAATPAAPASAAQKTAAKAAADGGGMSADEAAAKHAKRTACLKSAKDKKLVGAQKKAFVKDCTAAP